MGWLGARARGDWRQNALFPLCRKAWGSCRSTVIAVLHERKVSPNSVPESMGDMITRNPKRPLSPHMGIWKWGPAMAVSIVHRVTGNGLAVVGALGLIWWLAAAASGEAAYETFISWATWWPGYVVMVGLSWSFFQHLFSGLRHFVLDTGAGYELHSNKKWSLAVFAGAILATIGFWMIILGRGL